MANHDYRRFTEDINHEEYYQAYISKYGRSSNIVEEFRSTFAFVDYLYVKVEQVHSSYLEAHGISEGKIKEYSNLINNTKHAATSYTYTKSVERDEIYLKECLIELIDESNSAFEKKSGLEELNEVWVEPVLGLSLYFANSMFIKEIRGDLIRTLNIPFEILYFNSTVEKEFQKGQGEMKVVIDSLVKVSERLNRDYAPQSKAES